MQWKCDKAEVDLRRLLDGFLALFEATKLFQHQYPTSNPDRDLQNSCHVERRDFGVNVGGAGLQIDCWFLLSDAKTEKSAARKLTNASIIGTLIKFLISLP